MQTLVAPKTEFAIADDAIAELAAEYMPLIVLGVDDKAGCDKVHKARIVVRDKRVEIEKKRKELKADALEYGRIVDSEAKRLTALLEPIESHLQAEEDKVVLAKKRAEEEAERKRQAALKIRFDQLNALYLMMRPADVAEMDDDAFAALLSIKQAEKAERERLAAEESERHRIEAERLAAERAELDRIRREQEAAQARIDAEKKRIADEAAAKSRAEELERAKKEAAERAVRESEEKQQREAATAKAKAEAEEQSRILKEQMRPDKEKLLAIADAIAAIELPTVMPRAQKAANRIAEAIEVACIEIRNAVHEM